MAPADRRPAVGQPGVAGRGRASGSTRTSTAPSAADLAQLGDDLFAVLAPARRRAHAAPAPGRPGRAGRAALRAGRPAARGQDRPHRARPRLRPGRGPLVAARSTWWRRWRRWPAGPCSGWPRRTGASTTSRTSCSGSAASWTASRSWARCSADRGRARRQAGRAAARGARRQGPARSPRRCWSRPCASRAAAAWTGPPRSSPSWPRPAATATSRTSAPRCGCRPTQEQRLTESLTRLYGRPISLQVELDAVLLGGLVVRGRRRADRRQRGRPARRRPPQPPRLSAGPPRTRTKKERRQP